MSDNSERVADEESQLAGSTSYEPANATNNLETPQAEDQQEPVPHKSPILPEIPPADLGIDLTSIMSAGSPEMDKVNKRASNVQKLAMENEKLNAELKAMSARLEAAERRREELSQKKQMLREPPLE